ncbi:hypothetical protein NVP1084O_050 [Vibrio phage 1.084.O._10N.261.49.F5]|nr:hypothetical protein NVP1084O_050 [Vibrio phage 1.084.O._10N.261.49.F5]
MTVPSKVDIQKRKKKRDDLWKGLNENGSMTEKKLCTQLRSAIRQVWMKHPTKLSLIYDRTIPDMDDSTRTKWLIECESCHNTFKLNDVEINHKRGENPLQTLEDVLPFAQSILGVSHEDLEVLCKPCHAAFTYSERYGVTLEEAFKEKEVISKLKQTVVKQKAELKKAGFSASETSNEEKRRECYRKLFKGEIN